MRKKAWVLLLAMGALLMAGAEGALGLPDAEQPPPEAPGMGRGQGILATRR